MGLPIIVTLQPPQGDFNVAFLAEQKKIQPPKDTNMVYIWS